MEKERKNSAVMPSEHWEKKPSELGACSDLKYTDKPNPESLRESTDKLAEYVKKNKMKY